MDDDTIKAMLTLCAILPGGRFLDVGCGTGALLPFLLASNPRQIIAVDFSKKMLEIAKEKYSDSRIIFLQRNIFEVELPYFDQCFIHNSFLHFDDPERLLHHLTKQLCAGGRLTISHRQGKAATLPKGNPHWNLPSPVLAKLLAPHLKLDILVDTPGFVIASGVRPQT